MNFIEEGIFRKLSAKPVYGQQDHQAQKLSSSSVNNSKKASACGLSFIKNFARKLQMEIIKKYSEQLSECKCIRYFQLFSVF